MTPPLWPNVKVILPENEVAVNMTSFLPIIYQSRKLIVFLFMIQSNLHMAIIPSKFDLHNLPTFSFTSIDVFISSF